MCIRDRGRAGRAAPAHPFFYPMARGLSTSLVLDFEARPGPARHILNFLGPACLIPKSLGPTRPGPARSPTLAPRYTLRCLPILWLVLLRAWQLCEDELQENAFQTKTELRLQVDLNPGPLFFVYDG